MVFGIQGEGAFAEAANRFSDTCQGGELQHYKVNRMVGATVMIGVA
jgi:hypothetical protein